MTRSGSWSVTSSIETDCLEFGNLWSPKANSAGLGWGRSGDHNSWPSYVSSWVSLQLLQRSSLICSDLFWPSVLTSPCRLQILAFKASASIDPSLPVYALVCLQLSRSRSDSALEGVQHCCCQPFSFHSTTRLSPGLLGLSLTPWAAPQTQPPSMQDTPLTLMAPQPLQEKASPLSHNKVHTTAQALLTFPALFYIFPLFSWTL